MKRGERILMLWVMLCLSASAVGQKKWDGEGLDSLWSNDRNWFPDGIPLPTDDVIIDNERISGGYTIILPSGLMAVNIQSLSILPGQGNVIVVELPSVNNASTALTIGSSGNGFRIGKSGIFINNSGASSGNPIQLNGSFTIENGGRYIHRTQRGNATIVSKLLLEPSTYQGIFEFDVPGSAGYTLSVSGRQFGNLLLSAKAAGKKTYTGTGISSLRIYGDLDIADSSSFTSSLNNNIIIGRDLVVKGRLSINPSLSDTINRDLQFNGDSSSIAINGSWSHGNNFKQVLVSRGMLQLKSNITIENANASLKISPSASMMFGTYSASGSGTMMADSASTLGFGASEGISTDYAIGNIRLEKISLHPKTNHAFYGEGAQQTGGRFPSNAASLTVNKPNGQLTLSSPLQVSDSLKLEKGNLITDSINNLTFSGSKIQANSTAFIAGPFRYWSNSAKELQFPVGKAGYYAPITLSRKTTEPILIQAEYQAMGHPFPDSTIAFPVRSVSNSEYWTIKKMLPSDSLPSQDILLFSMGPNSASNIIGQPLLVRIASAAVKWELLPLYADNPTPNTIASAPTILNTGTYTFGSMFPSALPKEGLELCQQERNGFTRLSWTTEMDQTATQYVVEKNSGNGPFASMDSIPSKKKPGKTIYSFDFRSSSIRGNFIRIRSVDNKGRNVYSNILYIRPANEMLHIFPNPANNLIKVAPLNDVLAKVLLMNPMGQTIQARSWMRDHLLEMDISHLRPGKYFVVLNGEERKRVFPFIKQ